MSGTDLRDALRAYASGLETEMGLLRRIKRQAALQSEASAAHDYEALARITDERDRLMAALVQVEAGIKGTRQAIAASLDEVAALDEFAGVVERHRAAASLVAEIVSCDEDVRDALLKAEQARRLAAQTIEAGEQTLTAYRRVINPSWHSPALVNRRG
jgi:hypothetical protein